jgi:hypothetical protein
MALQTEVSIVKTFLAALAVAVGSSTSALAVGPPNPAAQQRTDQLIAELHGNPGRVLPAARRFVPKPWAVGQWAAYLVQRGDQRSVLKMSVVGKDARGFWVEYDTQSYLHRTITKVLSSRQPKTAAEAADIALVIVTKNDDQPAVTTDLTDPNSPMARMMKGLKGAMGGMLFAVDPSMPREDVTVTAGTFKGCFGFELRLGAGPNAKSFTGYGHPGVPVIGTVRTRSTDGEMTTELLDFGDTGAASALPAP